MEGILLGIPDQQLGDFSEDNSPFLYSLWILSSPIGCILGQDSTGKATT